MAALHPCLFPSHSQFVALTLRCPSTSLRNKFVSLITRLLTRIRASVAAALNRPARLRTPEQTEGGGWRGRVGGCVRGADGRRPFSGMPA